MEDIKAEEPINEGAYSPFFYNKDKAQLRNSYF